MLLIDNDAFLLLAASELLDQAIDCLGAKPADVRLLSALPYMLKKGKAFPSFKGVERQRAIKECARFASITDSPPAHYREALSSIHGIDPSDAVLLATTAVDASAELLSGDKRAMRALCNSQEPIADEIRKTISGRIICVEKVFHALVAAHGTKHVIEKAIPVRHDGFVRAVMSDGHVGLEAECLAAIQIYFNDLAGGLTAGLLRPL